MKRAYTITEFVAALVILVIIVCLALTAIRPQIKRAKKESFVNEANKIIKIAVNKYTSEIINDESVDDLYNHDNDDFKGKVCYNISDLKGKYLKKLKKSYKGSIEICYSSSCLYNSRIWLTNGKYYINGSMEPVIIGDVENKIRNVESCGLKN